MEAWISLDVAVAMVTKQTSPAEVNQTPKYHLSFGRRGDAMCTVIFPGCFHNKHSKCNGSDVTAAIRCVLVQDLIGTAAGWGHALENRIFQSSFSAAQGIFESRIWSCLCAGTGGDTEGCSPSVSETTRLLTNVPLYAEIQQRPYFLHFLSTYWQTSTQ